MSICCSCWRSASAGWRRSRSPRRRSARYVLLILQNTLNLQMVARLFRHLVRLPLAYFEKRHIGDILSRFASTEPIRALLAEGLIAAMIDGVDGDRHPRHDLHLQRQAGGRRPGRRRPLRGAAHRALPLAAATATRS